MPIWLLTALVTILIIWTILDVLAWVGAFFACERAHKQGRGFSILPGAMRNTMIIAVIWIILICYWLR